MRWSLIAINLTLLAVAINLHRIAELLKEIVR